MNLLPNTEKDLLKKGFRFRFLVMLNMLTSISFLVGIVMLTPAYFLIRGNFAVANPDNSLSEEGEDLNKQILDLPKEVDAKLKFVQSNMASKKAVDSLFKVVSSLPEKVTLKSVSFNRNQGDKEKKGIALTVFGVASDRESLVNFDTALKKSNYFSLVDIPVSSLTKDKNLPFSVNLFISD